MNILKKMYAALSVRERTILVFSSILLTGAVVTLAIIGIRRTTQEVAAFGGSYTEGVVGQPTFINPVIANTEIDKSIARLVFAPLQELSSKIEQDDKSGAGTSLSPVTSQNGRVWRVRLKENLHWQDGAKITSDDVIFTIQKIQDPTSQSPLAARWQSVAVNRLSELEVQLTLSTPYAFFDETILQLQVIPKHIFADIPPPNWRLSSYILKPVGSGAYQFFSSRMREDGFFEDYTLAENPNSPVGRPHIERFRFQFFPTSQKLTQAFNAGTIDGWVGISPEDVARVQRPYHAIAFRIPSYYALFFNQSKNPVLKDTSVRRALALAINREALRSGLFANRATLVNGPAPTIEHAGVPYNPDEAKKILDEAGWTLNSQGVREKGAGSSTTALSCTMTVPNIGFLVEMAHSIQSDWQHIGCATTVTTRTPEEITTRTIKNRDYEILLFGNILTHAQDLFSFWHSSQRFSPGINLSLYNNKTADDLMEFIRQSQTSPPTDTTSSRSGQLSELQDIIVSDMPAVFLLSPDYSYITTLALQGAKAQTIPEPSERFGDVVDWYVKTARVFR